LGSILCFVQVCAREANPGELAVKHAHDRTLPALIDTGKRKGLQSTRLTRVKGAPDATTDQVNFTGPLHSLNVTKAQEETLHAITDPGNASIK
jgi:hypothetical protein